MEPGYFVDFTHGTGEAEQSSWAKGEPMPRFWGGIKNPFGEQIPVVTFRCPKCCQLKSFAPPA